MHVQNQIFEGSLVIGKDVLWREKVSVVCQQVRRAVIVAKCVWWKKRIVCVVKQEEAIDGGHFHVGGAVVCCNCATSYYLLLTMSVGVGRDIHCCWKDFQSH